MPQCAAPPSQSAEGAQLEKLRTHTAERWHMQQQQRRLAQLLRIWFSQVQQNRQLRQGMQAGQALTSPDRWVVRHLAQSIPSKHTCHKFPTNSIPTLSGSSRSSSKRVSNSKRCSSRSSRQGWSLQPDGGAAGWLRPCSGAGRALCWSASAGRPTCAQSVARPWCCAHSRCEHGETAPAPPRACIVPSFALS